MRGTILVVDDLEANRLLLREMLESGGHHVLEASDGVSAIEQAAAERPDVVLVDVKMPGMNGFEVCTRLKTMSETRSLPVVFVTANYPDEADFLYGLELGGYDYLVKPISRPVLLARVGVMLRIRRNEERIRQLSMIDEFTGLYSKTYVVARLAEEMERVARRRSSLAVAMIDLDDFKSMNDRFGHPFGDRVLQTVATCFKENVRRYDSVGRYGGEEFLIILPNLGEIEGEHAIGRLRDSLASHVFAVNGKRVTATFSAGVVSWDFEASRDELVARADQALYAAKETGKNRTIRYGHHVSGRVPKAEGGNLR